MLPRALGVIAGVGIAGAGIWGALQFAKADHTILAFLCGAGAVGWGGQLAYAGITGKGFAEQVADATGRQPTVTQNVGESAVS